MTAAQPRRRRRWGRPAAAAGAVVVAGASTAAGLGLLGGGDGEAPAASNLPPASAEVTVTTLVATEEFDGTLGYGDPSPVLAGGAGVLTWRPGLGETIEQGEPVYEVNAEPVMLMYGSLPFYRTLRPGDSGPDVAQLEENLSALDYDGFTVDDEYTDATADAVARWQEDAGWPVTGSFEPARAVVATGAIRVAEHLVPLGGPATGELLSYTGTDRQITVDLDVADRQLVAEEMAVTVTMPDDSTADATVTSVGTVATSSGGTAPAAGAAAQPEQEETTTVEVVVTVDDEEALGAWDEAPVTVTVETDRREEVLAVPVEALVALAGGGYGVQVVDGGSTRYRAVSTGMFADGLVEIEGGGVMEGMLVGVPAS